MIRFGLCCIFRDQPIKFRTTTATANCKMKRAAALAKLSDLCMANADALLASIQFGMRNLPLAAVDILIVWGTIIWMIVVIWKHHRWVSVAQVPYFVWVSIATVLQLSMTWMNWGD
jgi:tryptophan-rich sensory protein